MSNLTEQQAKYIGFKFVKRYEHDHFVTNRYQKGILELEFTYNNEVLESTDLTMTEVNCMPLSFADLVKLDKVFCK